MSDTLSEAERLLNTIVSSRVRLASLRGDTASTPEPAHQDESKPVAETIRFDSMTATHHDATEPEPVPDDIDILNASWSASDDDPVFDTPPDDTGEQRLVLGLPDTDGTTDPEAGSDSDTASLFDDPLFDAQNVPPGGAHMADCSSEPSNEADDPFSFIDLIPGEPADDAPEPPQSDRPPVRTKPVMPLPTATAIGAPRASDATVLNTTSAPTEIEPPQEEIEPLQDESDDPLEVIERAPQYGLSQPRSIEPQIIDPDRERLDVDVYEHTETTDDWDSDYEPHTPRLTESSPPEAPKKAEHIGNADEAVFDAISSAHQAIRRGALKQADTLLSDALDWDPKHMEARLMRGRCKRDSGDQVAALSDFIKALEAAPHSPLPHVELGNLFFYRKDYARAVQHYSDALERDPGHAMALCRRGICYHYRRRPDHALDDLRSAARINPDIANIDRYIRMVSTHNHR